MRSFSRMETNVQFYDWPMIRKIFDLDHSVHFTYITLLVRLFITCYEIYLNLKIDILRNNSTSVSLFQIFEICLFCLMYALIRLHVRFQVDTRL